MPTDEEVQRLIQVYQGYRQSSSIQAQWSDTNPGNQAIVVERQAAIARLLAVKKLAPLHAQRVLDVGCGGGDVLCSLPELGAEANNLYGIDLLPERIAVARQRHPDCTFSVMNAEKLEFPTATFDMVIAFTVFSSILNRTMASNIAQEMRRVLRSGGAMLWYDLRYNNPRNPHVRGLGRRDIHALFPGFALHMRSITVAPPLVRRLGHLTPRLYPLLASVPLLRTHYLGVIVKP